MTPSLPPSQQKRLQAHFGFTGLPFRKNVVATKMFDSESQRELRNGLLLWPYARADISNGKLKKTTESGVGNLNLIYLEQTVDAVQLSLGLLAESPHSTNFGWVMPRLRVELQYEDEGNSDATVLHASQSAGPSFSITPGRNPSMTTSVLSMS